MLTITKMQLEDYQRLYRDRNKGRIITSDDLRFICDAYKNDSEAIGKHILGALARIQNERRCR